MSMLDAREDDGSEATQPLVPSTTPLEGLSDAAMVAALRATIAAEQRNRATLLAVARASRGATDPQVVLEAIYAQLRTLLQVDAFSVVMANDDVAQSYRYMLLIDEDERYIETDLRRGGLTGHILQTREPLFFHDLHAEYPAGLPRPFSFGNTTRRSRAWMGVPLLAGRVALGGMVVSSYQSAMYTQADFELLIALADLAAVAIENSLLYQEQERLNQSLATRIMARQEELAVLSALAAGLSRGRVTADLLNEALERVLWLFGLAAGVVWLHDQRVSLRRAAVRADGPPPQVEERLALTGDSLEAQALRSGGLVQHHDEQWIAAVPLEAHGRVAGVLTLWGNRELSAEEAALLRAAGDQIGLGIENSRLLQQRERQIAQLEALSTIAEGSAATREVMPMFRQVWATLRDALPMTGFVAALYDPVAGALDHGLGWHRDVGEQNVRVVLPTNSYAAEVLRTGDPLLVHITEGRSAPLWWERDMATWMGVPLLNHDNDPIGILALQSQQADAFDRRDLQFLDNVSHQLTLNVLNAQLYAEARESAAVAERRAHNLALVHRMSRLVSASLNPAEVVRVAAEQITELFGINHSAIVVFAPDYRSGEVVAEYPAKGGLGLRIAIEPNGQLQRDLNLGEPLVITDPQHDPRLDAVHSLLADNDVTVMVLTPMISRGRSFGLISLDVSTFGRGFTAEEEELCRTIAAQVGVALENARLHQNTVTRVEQELEIARSIQANLFPRSLPSIPGATIAGRCLPAFETGGDFYDVLALGDERYGFVIGDVSGKSLAAAMLMAVARSIVRSEAIDHAAPETVMMETNRLIAQDVPPNTFVALCYAVYNSTSRELVVANAGQITPLLRQADGLITWLPVQSNLPLGIVADVPYHATPIRLHPGDTVLFLTDGLIEAFSSDREMYGFERLQALFAEAGTQSPAQLVETLLDTVSNWQVGDRRHDDMTVIVAQLAG